MQDEEQDKQQRLSIGRTSCQISKKDEWQNQRQDKQCLVAKKESEKGKTPTVTAEGWRRKEAPL